MTKKRCLNCRAEFYAQRNTAKYCCVNCRVAYHRQESVSALYDRAVSAITKLERVSSSDADDAKSALNELKSHIRWSLYQLNDADERARREMFKSHKSE